jgi:hypothetical protein
MKATKEIEIMLANLIIAGREFEKNCYTKNVEKYRNSLFEKRDDILLIYKEIYDSFKWRYRNEKGDFEELPKVEKLVAFQYKVGYYNGKHDIISCCDDDFRIAQFKKFANKCWYRWCYLPEE